MYSWHTPVYHRAPRIARWKYLIQPLREVNTRLYIDGRHRRRSLNILERRLRASVERSASLPILIDHTSGSTARSIQFPAVRVNTSHRSIWHCDPRIRGPLMRAIDEGREILFRRGRARTPELNDPVTTGVRLGNFVPGEYARTAYRVYTRWNICIVSAQSYVATSIYRSFL